MIRMEPRRVLEKAFRGDVWFVMYARMFDLKYSCNGGTESVCKNDLHLKIPLYLLHASWPTIIVFVVIILCLREEISSWRASSTG